jgi:hypothetical protein
MIRIWGLGKAPTKKPAAAPQKTQWRAVSLVPGARCCAAVKAAARRRWLSPVAPRFPLPGCDVKTCECRYQHHSDRRAGPRRRADRDALPRQYEGKERRATRRDRRLPDK